MSAFLGCQMKFKHMFLLCSQLQQPGAGSFSSCPATPPGGSMLHSKSPPLPSFHHAGAPPLPSFPTASAAAAAVILQQHSAGKIISFYCCFIILLFIYFIIIIYYLFYYFILLLFYCRGWCQNVSLSYFSVNLYFVYFPKLTLEFCRGRNSFCIET